MFIDSRNCLGNVLLAVFAYPLFKQPKVKQCTLSFLFLQSYPAVKKAEILSVGILKYTINRMATKNLDL